MFKIHQIPNQLVPRVIGNPFKTFPKAKMYKKLNPGSEISRFLGDALEGSGQSRFTQIHTANCGTSSFPHPILLLSWWIFLKP